MPSPEVEAALLAQNTDKRIKDLEIQFLVQKQALDGLKDERDKAMRWGIIALGTAVMGMATWIINLFTAGHIR